MQIALDAPTAPPIRAASAPQWCGWFRASRRERWQRIACAETHDECWSALLDALEQQGRRGGDSTVTAAGIDPR